MTDQEILLGLKGFIDAEGRLSHYPAKRKKKLLALQYLAGKLEPERRYREREINELLNCWHLFGDHCLLRRELWDYNYMEREKNGSFYWQAEPSKWPVFEEGKGEIESKNPGKTL